VVEHSLGKGEVESSILSGSTSLPRRLAALKKLEQEAINVNHPPLVLSLSKDETRSYFDKLSMSGVLQIFCE
jgi:hypothetical protein